MILRKYQDFRAAFTLPGFDVPIDGFFYDGLPYWPSGKIRANGFSLPDAPMVLRTSGGLAMGASVIGPLLNADLITDNDDLLYPFTVTVNALASDDVPGIDEYDWYVSQRNDPVRYPHADGTIDPTNREQYLVVSSAGTGQSGTIQIGLNYPKVATILPGVSGIELYSPLSLSRLFRKVAVYCQRRSDKAIQWAKIIND